MASPKGPGAQGHSFQRPKQLKRTISLLLRYIGKYKLLMIVVVLLLFISSGATIAGSYFLKPLVNNYILPGKFNGFAKMLAWLGLIYFCGAAASYGYARIMVRISQQTVWAIRRDLFDKMQDLPLEFFDSYTHGELMSRYINDVDHIGEALNNSFANLISNSVTFVGTLLIMVVISPGLTLITFGFLAAMVGVTRVIGKRSRNYFKLQQKSLGELNGYIEEMISGQKVVKVFCHESEAVMGFNQRNVSLQETATRAQIYSGIMMPTLGNMSHINYAITCGVGGLMAIAGRFDIGSLVSYLQYVRQVSQPIAHTSQNVNMVLAALAGAERIFEILDQTVEADQGTITLTRVTSDQGEIQETAERSGYWAWKEQNDAAQVVLTPLKGDVRFENVVFEYQKNNPVLKGISLFAKPGQKIALVGSTGAGKTTITNLLTRFYEISSGRITYDGIDIRQISKAALRSSLGMVLQDTHLFTGTIADNIRYGRLDASDEEVVAAAKLANAHSFIMHLPQGYNTVLSGDGSNLSQGQRQLLSIARAAVADPPVLILDEATSSVDTRTEKLIEKGMDRLMENRTVFVIAHRLSTVRNAKAILVLEGGRIIERGSHEELLKQQGRYYRLYTGQAELG